MKMIKEKHTKKPSQKIEKACGDEWARTTDSRIFSPMLYQLSYITLNEGTKVDKF